MDKRLLLAIGLIALVLLSSFSIGQVSISDRIFDKQYSRQGEGIYIDTTASPVKVAGQDIRIKWGYDKEVIEVPYKKAYLPFWIEHRMPAAIDPCQGKLIFSTTNNASTQFLYDYNVAMKNYSYDVNSAKCEAPEDKSHCWIYEKEFNENSLKHCDREIVDGTCYWDEPFFNGIYSYIYKKVWLPIEDLESCPLEPNTKYWFRHFKELEVGQHEVFDVNAEFSLPSTGEFVFQMPAPEWKSTAQSDFKAQGYDLNYTDVTSDGNVMPMAYDWVYNDQNQAFYDNNLAAQYSLDSQFIGLMASDTNVLNTIGTIGDVNAWGVFDSNALNATGNGQYASLSNFQLPGNYSNEATITMWVYAPGLGEGSAGRFTEFGVGYTTWFINGTDCMRVNWDFSGTDGSWRCSSGGNMKYNQWVHLALTYDARSVDNDPTIYVNGMEMTALARLTAPEGTAVSFDNTAMYIGSNAAANRELNGYIDEVKIYNRVLTRNEVIDDYNGWMKGKYYSPIQDGGAAGDVDWETISWGEDTDQNNSVTVDYRGCSDKYCDTAGAWMTGLSGQYGSHTLHADANRYFQYRANLDTNTQSWNALVGEDALGLLNKPSYARIYDVTVAYNYISAGGTCDCPSSGNWEINDGSNCTLSSLCNTPANVHISSGSLVITSTGTLVMPSGNKMVVKDGQKFVIEDGGKLVIVK